VNLRHKWINTSQIYSDFVGSWCTTKTRKASCWFGQRRWCSAIEICFLLHQSRAFGWGRITADRDCIRYVLRTLGHAKMQ